jgi:hypothetical protein
MDAGISGGFTLPLGGAGDSDGPSFTGKPRNTHLGKDTR